MSDKLWYSNACATENNKLNKLFLSSDCCETFVESKAQIATHAILSA
jgi:hypothetical protein